MILQWIKGKGIYFLLAFAVFGFLAFWFRPFPPREQAKAILRIEGPRPAAAPSTAPGDSGSLKGKKRSLVKKPRDRARKSGEAKEARPAKTTAPAPPPETPAAPNGETTGELFRIVRQIAYLWPDSFTEGKPEDVFVEIRLPGEKLPVGERRQGEAQLHIESKVPEPRLRVTLVAPGFEMPGQAEQVVKVPRAGKTFVKWVVIPKEAPDHQFNFSFSAEYAPDDFRPARVAPYKFPVQIRGTWGLPPWVFDWPAKGAAAVTGFFAFIGGVVSGFENLRKLQSKLAKLKLLRKRDQGNSS